MERMDRRGATEVEAMIDSAFSSADSNAAMGATPPTERRVILVDGFNVLHAVLLGKERETGWWKREPRERLLRRISQWNLGPDEIWVAFDGTQPAWSVWAEPVVHPTSTTSRGPIVHSVFVESADDWIVRRARRAADPHRTVAHRTVAHRTVVVSADRKVTGRARSAGCEIWTPWVFVSRCPEVRMAAKTIDSSDSIVDDSTPQAHSNPLLRC